ncbi:integrator complex subunit 10-like [Lineus longissimus]|uniref:integrator complex subunit 10-like n=1 Tax=Lineus longissimus TaxID=88925 RepID=UPI002B4DD0E0
MASAIFQINSTMTNALPDEEWLVLRARQSLKTDPYAAKAWLITARTLYPLNFSIQFETYCVEKSERNLKESAKLLQEMFTNFPNEPQLWSEIRSITESLQTDVVDSNTQFLIDLISAVPTDIQCRMLFKMADSTHDILERCRLKLLALSRFPHLIQDHGTELIDTLITTEKHSHQMSPLNCYRKYLVTDVLPQVLRAPSLAVHPNILIKWLQKSLEFYISYVTQPPVQETNQHSEMLSPNKPYLRRASIIGLSDKESYILHPWQNLYEIVSLAGRHLKWEDSSKFTKSGQSPENRWQHILHLHQESKKQQQQPSSQLFYSTVVLFMETMYLFSSKIDSEQFTSTASGCHSNHLVLIEAMKANDPEEPRPKKLRTEHSSVPKIHVNRSINVGSEITQSFVTAFKCWELLHSAKPLLEELNQLLVLWRAESWPWLNSFEADCLIYQGNFKDAITKIRSTGSNTYKGPAETRKNLQLASCHFCLGKLSEACSTALDVMSSLTAWKSQDSASPPMPSIHGSGRQLQLLACTDVEIMPYCIEMLLICFKERALRPKVKDDLCLGHMIVLLQYHWPKHEHLFTQAVEKIRQQGAFTYSAFFNYIITIDILEEFSYLKTKDGGKIVLDVLSTSTKLIAQQRTVTRGVNKGVKEDFQLSMQKQVSRSEENIEALICQFLMEEREFLQQNLQ